MPGSNGNFVIYLGVEENSDLIWFLLAHEVMHLLNPFIQDWYMEGLASYFAVQFCQQENVKLGGWLNIFNKIKENPYACSYRMIRDIAEVTPEALRSMRNYTLTNKKYPNTLKIDVDRWLASMSVSDRNTVLAKIRPYMKEMKKYSNSRISFTIPSAIYND